MPLEQFDYIPNLVPTNPEGTDPFSQGDDHIRGIKETLLNTFPNFTGAPVTVTEEEINEITEIPGILAEVVITGEVRIWTTVNAPEGWLLCQGQAISRVDYAALFAVIGVTYGPGDATTTFNIPDFTGRVPVGVGGSFSLAEKQGAETVSLSVANMPAHSHSYTNPLIGSGQTASNGAANCKGYPTTNGGTTNTQGSGSAHNNLQPSLGINFMIKT